MALDDTGRRNAASHDLRERQLVKGTVRLRRLAATVTRLVTAGRPHAHLALMLLVFAVVGGVYLRTLCPGIYPVADTPKFQYLGRVLGTAHSPGYPLYVLLTHAWSYLPIGSLAYRINLFSALWGAVAAALVFRVNRALGCTRPAAASAALALAFGGIFWSQAIIAEVYSLAAALLAGTVLALLHWQQTGRKLWFYLAVGQVALSLGHHFTTIMVLPGLLFFVWLSGRVRILRDWRVVATSAALLLLGAAQYLFIIIRTRQGAAVIEAWANNLWGLKAVLLVDSASSRLWAYSPQQILHQILPMLLRETTRELGPAALALLLLGLWRTLATRRWHLLALLLVSAAGPAAFILNYDAGYPDILVFFIPMVLLLTPFVALGLDWLTARRWIPAAVAALACALLPAGQLWRNFKANDLSQRLLETRLAEALFERLPRPCVLIADEPSTLHILRYKILGEGVGVGVRVLPPTASIVDRALLLDRPVFAIGRARLALDALAHGYRFEPFVLPIEPLDEYLASRRDEIVLVATGGAAGRAALPALRAYASRSGLTIVTPADSLTLIGMAGRRDGWLWSANELTVSSGTQLAGTRAPVALAASGSASGAIVRVGGEVAAQTESGVLLVTVAPADGHVVKRYVLGSDLRVPIGSRSYPVYRVTREPAAEPIAAGR